MQSRRFKRQPLPLALALSVFAPAALAQGAAGVAAENTLPEIRVLGTAENELKQAPGVSTISREDIANRPPVNDLSDIIRMQPGVNLTGNSTSGQRGNNRQIDLRGMGPENTLILVDGKPVTSRNSVRYGWRGERDTRGDTNWVPAEEVERIEVIRGPAAARYGSGAAGGVVNIITQKVSKDKTTGHVTTYLGKPEDSKEGDTQRIGFGLSGPLTENLSYRLYGNVNRTEADAWDINAGYQSTRSGNQSTTLPAGREGVRNRDLNGLLSWRLTPQQTLDFEAGFSRQGNIYAGDTQNTNSNARVTENINAETNRLYRQNYALTHRGQWDFGTSLAYLQQTTTRNTRLNEGLAGGLEGIFSDSAATGFPYGFKTSTLKEYTAHAEVNLPMRLGRLNQVATLGVEWRSEKLDDPASTSLNPSTAQWGGIAVPGLSSANRSSRSSAHTVSAFAESNIELGANTILTPALRFDHHSVSGGNWSPSLNLSHALSDRFSIKAGIARAYKTPNLYQSNPNYLIYSAGQGCWGTPSNIGCYLMGNDDLKAETSVNKELGIEFKNDGYVAGLTYFHNDYKNKIEAGTEVLRTLSRTRNLYQWVNVPEALVEGLEGNLRIPLGRTLDWSTNFTYMLNSKNKSTNDVLSVIPKYTVNSTLDWRATDKFTGLLKATWYGRQTPKTYDFKGIMVTGSSTNEVAPYMVVGLGASYTFNKTWRATAGVNNLFDKRIYRAGNAAGVANIAGAGAFTYNEPGRAYYVSATASF